MSRYHTWNRIELLPYFLFHKVDTYLFDKMELLTRESLGTERAHIMPILYDDEIFVCGGWAGTPLKTCEW